MIKYLNSDTYRHSSHHAPIGSTILLQEVGIAVQRSILHNQRYMHIQAMNALSSYVRTVIGTKRENSRIMFNSIQ